MANEVAANREIRTATKQAASTLNRTLETGKPSDQCSSSERNRRLDCGFFPAVMHRETSRERGSGREIFVRSIDDGTSRKAGRSPSRRLLVNRNRSAGADSNCWRPQVNSTITRSSGCGPTSRRISSTDLNPIRFGVRRCSREQVLPTRTRSRFPEGRDEIKSKSCLKHHNLA